MATAAHRKAAIDVGLLYGDTWGVSHHREAVKYLWKDLKFEIIICPTVIKELDVAEIVGTEKISGLTNRVRQELDDSIFLIEGHLSTGIDDKIRDQAKIIVEKGLIPNGSKNDARLLIEASHFGCSDVITVRASLLEADNSALCEALREFGYEPVAISSPKALVGPNAVRL